MVLATLSFSDVGLSGAIDFKEGATIFNRDCATCHTIGGGELAAPDLAGIHSRRSATWLHGILKSAQGMIDSGDKDVAALVTKYNDLVMPDTDLSEDHIADVLAYIKSKSGPSKGAAAQDKTQATTETEPVAEDTSTKNILTTENIVLGQKLFQGRLPFSNGGATCIACHHVSGKAIIAGGSLARDLTKCFSRIGEKRISGTISHPPFATMKQAYKNNTLTPAEVDALTAFLINADKESAEQPTNKYGTKMLVSGLVGLALILGFFGFIFRGRKKRSVNQDIYDRQIKSE